MPQQFLEMTQRFRVFSDPLEHLFQDIPFFRR
jgi:hypothetical protein